MAAASTKPNWVKLVAGMAVVAGASAGLVGAAGVATADPVVSVNGEQVETPTPVTISWPGGAWAGKDLSEGWPGGAWAGHDWSKGYPGGGYANGKGGGAWSHSDDE